MKQISMIFILISLWACNNNQFKVSQSENNNNLVQSTPVDSIKPMVKDSLLVNEAELDHPIIFDFATDAKMAGLKMKKNKNFDFMDESNCEKIYFNYLSSLKNSLDTFFTNNNIERSKLFIEALDSRKNSLELTSNVKLKLSTYKVNMMEILINKKLNIVKLRNN